MSDSDNSTPSSAPAASKRKKCTPEQRIARLEQQLARAKAQQQQNNRKLQTRAKIILGAAFLGYLNSLPTGRNQTSLEKLTPFITTGRDRQALLDSGLLPDTVTLDNVGDTEKPDSGSVGSETGDESGD